MNLEQTIEELRAEIAELKHLFLPLSELLVSARDVARAKGLHRNTIAQNDKIEKFAAPSGGIVVKLESVANLKKRRKRSAKKTR